MVQSIAWTDEEIQGLLDWWYWWRKQPWPEHWNDLDSNGKRISAREYIRRAHPEFHNKMMADLARTR